jgi:hypothetical protein
MPQQRPYIGYFLKKLTAEVHVPAIQPFCYVNRTEIVSDYHIPTIFSLSSYCNYSNSISYQFNLFDASLNRQIQTCFLQKQACICQEQTCFRQNKLALDIFKIVFDKSNLFSINQTCIRPFQTCFRHKQVVIAHRLLCNGPIEVVNSKIIFVLCIITGSKTTIKPFFRTDSMSISILLLLYFRCLPKKHNSGFLCSKKIIKPKKNSQ